MVFFFTARDEKFSLFMGRDKFENEELINYGWPEDVWFHVDDLSSAHVYLRLPVGLTIGDIPEDVLEECVQLTKANSIQGCKQPTVTVIYTSWANLRKGAEMDVGQVSFHDTSKVISVKNVKKDAIVLNRLNKTKREETCDFRALREQRDAAELQEKKQQVKEAKIREQKHKEEEIAKAKERSYDRIFDEKKMKSNKAAAAGKSVQEAEEDFM